MARSACQGVLLATLLAVFVACTGTPPAAVPPKTPASSTTGGSAPATAPFGDPAATPLPAADRAALQLVLDDAVRVFERDPQSPAGAPGITAAIVTRGGRWSGAAGTGGDGTPLVPDAMMNIASITKTFTAAEVVHLAQRGLIDLDVPASQYLGHPLLAQQPTVRQLLSMRSGVPEHTNDTFFAAVTAMPSKSWTATEALAYAAGPPMPPGTEFAYTNSNYLLLGLLIEKVTNTTYADALRHDLLQQPNLRRVAIQDSEAPTAPLGAPAPDITTLPTDPYLPSRALASAAGAAGGIAADAESVAQWGYELYGGRLLPPHAVHEMIKPGPEGYGLGTAVESLSNLPWTGIGHTGGIPGYSTGLIVVPEHQTAVAVLLPHHSDAHYIARMLLMVLLTE